MCIINILQFIVNYNTIIKNKQYILQYFYLKLVKNEIMIMNKKP